MEAYLEKEMTESEEMHITMKTTWKYTDRNRMKVTNKERHTYTDKLDVIQPELTI